MDWRLDNELAAQEKRELAKAQTRDPGWQDWFEDEPVLHALPALGTSSQRTGAVGSSLVAAPTLAYAIRRFSPFQYRARRSFFETLPLETNGNVSAKSTLLGVL